MAKKIVNVDILQEYFKGVILRANHHAQNVVDIAYSLLGIIVCYKDENADIQVLEQGGETKNVLWVNIKGKRYAFSYNHNTQSIEIRDENLKGAVLLSVNNSTAISDIVDFF